jgi:hypothetical protein
VSKPPTRAAPELCRSSVTRILTVVVFPEPFGPRKPNTSPHPTAKETPASAVEPPG